MLDENGAQKALLKKLLESSVFRYSPVLEAVLRYLIDNYESEDRGVFAKHIAIDVLHSRDLGDFSQAEASARTARQTGASTYVLNHFAAGWDPTGTTLIGPGNIREKVTLGPNGNQFSGTFTVDQYDESNNLLAHLQGTITATRITVTTPPSSIF
jgi:hypothetical protein